jgi:SNF2 family DNA or RNA helicase
MIFLDEAHEIQNMNKSSVLINTIKEIHSISKWNITGTPFANGLNSFVNLVTYNSTFNGSCRSLQDIVDTGLNEHLIKLYQQLFRRNTKQSIKTEYAGTLISEKMHSLDFTQQERSLYDSYIAGGKSKHIDFLIKICCHSELYEDTRDLIKNCKTLAQIQEVMLNYNKTQLQIIQSTLRTLQHDIETTQTDIINMGEGNPYDDVEMHILNNHKIHLATLKRKHTAAKTQVNTVERTYNYLVNAIQSIESSDETCPICLDTIHADEKTITKCGHKFCWSCIYETHEIKANDRGNSSFTCPTCNTPITNKDIYIFKQEQSTIIENELQQIIQLVKSTKIGNIIHYLKTEIVLGDKVILFSQWDEMLHKVGNLLQEQKLKIVYCSGTVFQRKRAIQNFMDPTNDTNIILLSSRNAASGINLTEANKIILLEPVYGSSDYRANIESQAIGRADRIGQKRHIEVHRFIIKNTIEEDIIDGKIDDNEICQLRM